MDEGRKAEWNGADEKQASEYPAWPKLITKWSSNEPNE